ncbi:MAG: helix-turn-helix domain-containing protein [Saprospiraceae bacterium]|nr:helix-turn-helix domain-containing protein [Saprospiraceae bacterium]
MRYTELLPDEIFSRHIECFWQMELSELNNLKYTELLVPTCTFNIVFIDSPCYFRIKKNQKWKITKPGAYFLGQHNSCIQLRSSQPLQITGVRFKPFAFARIIDTPIFKLTDELTPLEELFDTSSLSPLITQITTAKNKDIQFHLLNELMFSLFEKSLSIDEILRAQLNYILDRKGVLQISELFTEFKVSKVTLRNHFVNKVGLTPKKVSQIWRMNHFFQIKEDNPLQNLTSLCLDAGFYDQAHFIKEFKLLFGLTPRKFCLQNDHLVKIAHQNISRRFTNQYDPR